MIKFSSLRELATALVTNKELRPVAEDVLRVCLNTIHETGKDFQHLPLMRYVLNKASLGERDDSFIVEALNMVREMEEGDDDIENWLGGSVLVCETEEDLKEITSVDFGFSETMGRWPNITEDASIGHWDICEYIGSPPAYCLVCLCSNNAGGNMFYVPASLFEAARIEEHVKEYAEVWK